MGRVGPGADPASVNPSMPAELVIDHDASRRGNHEVRMRPAAAEGVQETHPVVWPLIRVIQ